MKLAEDAFKDETEDAWQTVLGEIQAERFRFNTMLTYLYQVIALEDAPKDTVTVRTQNLINTYTAEKVRGDDERQWDDRIKAQHGK